MSVLGKKFFEQRDWVGGLSRVVSPWLDRVGVIDRLVTATSIGIFPLIIRSLRQNHMHLKVSQSRIEARGRLWLSPGEARGMTYLIGRFTLMKTQVTLRKVCISYLAKRTASPTTRPPPIIILDAHTLRMRFTMITTERWGGAVLW